MSIYRTDNPIADFERHEAEQLKALKQMPICSECGNPIQEDFCYEIDGEPVCDDCMHDNHRVFTESFM